MQPSLQGGLWPSDEEDACLQSAGAATIWHAQISCHRSCLCRSHTTQPNHRRSSGTHRGVTPQHTGPESTGQLLLVCSCPSTVFKTQQAETKPCQSREQQLSMLVSQCKLCLCQEAAASHAEFRHCVTYHLISSAIRHCTCCFSGCQ